MEYQKGDIALYFFNNKWNIVEIVKVEEDEDVFGAERITIAFEGTFGKKEKEVYPNHLVTSDKFKTEYKLMKEGYEELINVLKERD